MLSTKEIVLGGSLLAGIIGVAVILRNSNTPAPPKPTNTTPSAPQTPKTVTVTNTNNGQTINLNVGDTLLVVLTTSQVTNANTDVTSETTYDYNISPENLLTAGNMNTNTTTNTVSQAWVAVAAGTAALVYYSSDGITSEHFNVVISKPQANA